MTDDGDDRPAGADLRRRIREADWGSHAATEGRVWAVYAAAGHLREQGTADAAELLDVAGVAGGRSWVELADGERRDLLATLLARVGGEATDGSNWRWVGDGGAADRDARDSVGRDGEGARARDGGERPPDRVVWVADWDGTRAALRRFAGAESGSGGGREAGGTYRETTVDGVDRAVCSFGTATFAVARDGRVEGSMPLHEFDLGGSGARTGDPGDTDRAASDPGDGSNVGGSAVPEGEGPVLAFDFAAGTVEVRDGEVAYTFRRP